LGVVEPFSTGIGGDCFMLLWSAAEQQLYGLNGSGRAPRAATIDTFAACGQRDMPSHGMLAVTVPGAVDAWATALARFGKRTLAQALTAAIEYAERGFPVSEIIARQWELTVGLLQHPEAVAAFTIDGRAPHLGEVVRLPDLAQSLRAIATGGADVFYRGALAERIAAFSRKHGGLLAADDLATHATTWVTPIATDYRGYHVYELPPNGQGLTALIALNILECFDLGAHTDAALRSHLLIESVKLAFADRNRFIADPEHVDVPTAELLSKDYAQGRAALIRLDRALKAAQPGRLRSGTDTVYLTTADAEGNVVSLINSLYFPFGSGMVVDGTGIALQNRGYGFVLDPQHPNCIAPGKRPFHTIIPGMLFQDQRPLVSFGVMGGDMQAQGHVQLVSNLLDAGMNIQDAIDAPRFHYLDTDRVALERAYDERIATELVRRSHAIQDASVALAHGGFGGAQGIMIHPATGAYWGGSDWRKDGCAIGY
jgi:gamma-glutamyltranspeptidase/glutathione hydrolase